MATTEQAKSILDSQVTEVAMRAISPHPKNPRKGDIKAIAESLQTNGQFRPLIVQRSTGHIIGGNHTYLGAKRLKWTKIKVVYLDVTDEQAQRIMLADNRTSDLGTYDTALLAEILKGLPTPVGTGYETADVSAILAAIEDENTELMMDVIRPSFEPTFAEPGENDLDTRLQELQERSQAIADAEATPDMDDLEDIQAKMQGILALNDDVQFSTSNYWGIPDLRLDMIPDKLPQPLTTWAGSDSNKDDGVSWYVYPYGASAKDMPWERSIMCFFVDDERFYNWYDEAAYYVAKLVASGCKMAIEHDYSIFTEEPRVVHLYSTYYKSRWLARYMQEAGIKVIPRLTWADMESIKYAMLGIPKNCPVVALQMQVWSHLLADSFVAECLREFCREIKPKQVLVYAGKPGREYITKHSNLMPKGTEIITVPNFGEVRRETGSWGDDKRKVTSKAKKIAKKQPRTKATAEAD